MTPTRRNLSHRVLTGLGVVVLAGGSAFTANAAIADWMLMEETAGKLELYWSDESDPLVVDDYQYGQRVFWNFSASLEEASAADFSFEITATGAMAEADGGLHVALRSCDAPFDGPIESATCPAGEQELIAWSPVVDVATTHSGQVWTLPTLTVASDRYFIVELGSRDTVAQRPELAGTSSTLAVGLHASAVGGGADEVDEKLAQTGGDFVQTAFIGIGLSMAGLLLLVLAALVRRRQPAGQPVAVDDLETWLASVESEVS